MPALSVFIKCLVKLTVYQKKRLIVCYFVPAFCFSAILSAQQTIPVPVSAFTAPVQPQISFTLPEKPQENPPEKQYSDISPPPQLQNVAEAFRQLPVPKFPNSKKTEGQFAEQPAVQPAAFSVEKTAAEKKNAPAGGLTTYIPMPSGGSGNVQNREQIVTEKSDSLLDQPLVFGKGGSKDETTGDGTNKNGVRKPKLSSQFTPLVSVVGSLLIVLSAFLFMALLFKKFSRQTGRLLPSEAFENLGKTNLSPKIQLQLLRLGNRLILVSLSSDGVSALTEIIDPDEVVPLLGMCRRQDKNSAVALFQKTLTEVVNPESDNTDYFGNEQKTDGRRQTAAMIKSGGIKPAAARRSSHLDLISEPDSGLAGILANGIPNKGGRYV